MSDENTLVVQEVVEHRKGDVLEQRVPGAHDQIQNLLAVRVYRLWHGSGHGSDSLTCGARRYSPRRASEAVLDAAGAERRPSTMPKLRR